VAAAYRRRHLSPLPFIVAAAYHRRRLSPPSLSTAAVYRRRQLFIPLFIFTPTLNATDFYVTYTDNEVVIIISCHLFSLSSSFTTTDYCDS
jgi:hypothetical protein